MRSFLLIAISAISLTSFSQQINPTKRGSNFSFVNDQFVSTDSGIFIVHYSKKCKDILTSKTFFPIKADTSTAQLSSPVISKKVPFIKIHGNITYDFFYRSGLDNPILQEDFNKHLDQHTEKVYMNILFKDKYPIKVAFVIRQSNSSYFRNFADINLQFDHFGYNKNLKQEVLNKLPATLNNRPDISMLKALVEQKEKQFLNLKGWLENPATLQKIIEERERQYARQSQRDNSKNMPGESTHKLPGINNTDSTTRHFTALYQSKKEEADSISKQVKSLQQKIDSAQSNVQQKLSNARQKLYRARNEKDIRKIAASNGIDVAPDKTGSKLAAVKTFSLGRSMINYTELTAQNVAITGINVEYNPSYYAALAAGKIDYRFRDFYNKNTNSNGQYLVLGRIGIGDPEKKALIFTAFQGRKNSSLFVLNDTAANSVNIVGYSLESIFKKDENTGVSFEVAKSTKPITGNLQTNKQINALWKFNDQTNLGVNIKAQTLIPQTNTKLSGFYRKTGENFQSFSLFSYNTDQTAWLARADQHFLKQKIVVTGMLRRNDFTNPFTDKTFKTSTIFKSILLNIKIPRYPSLNLGYYPGSQLYIVNKEKIRENAYYILNGSLVHSYFYKGISMNSSLVYNQYFNKATDSGFILYKGMAWYAHQTIFLKKLQLQAGYSYNNQPELTYFTVEGYADYALKEHVKIALGAKYNKTSEGNNYWGEKIEIEIDFKQSGRLQFQYEKSYLPTINQTLYAVEIGRVSWFKYF